MTRTPSPSPEFYFDSGKSVVLMAYKTITTNIVVLSLPGEEIDFVGIFLPVLSVKSPSVYSMKELTSQKTIMGMMPRKILHQFRIDNAIQVKVFSQRGGVFIPAVADTIGALREVITSPSSLIDDLFTSPLLFL